MRAATYHVRIESGRSRVARSASCKRVMPRASAARASSRSAQISRAPITAPNATHSTTTAEAARRTPRAGAATGGRGESRLAMSIPAATQNSGSISLNGNRNCCCTTYATTAHASASVNGSRPRNDRHAIAPSTASSAAYSSPAPTPPSTATSMIPLCARSGMTAVPCRSHVTRGDHLRKHDPVALGPHAEDRVLFDHARADRPVVEAPTRRTVPEVEGAGHPPAERRHREQHDDRGRGERDLAPPPAHDRAVRAPSSASATTTPTHAPRLRQQQRSARADRTEPPDQRHARDPRRSRRDARGHRHQQHRGRADVRGLPERPPDAVPGKRLVDQ